MYAVHKVQRGSRARKSRKNGSRPTGDKITRIALRNHISSVAAQKCKGEGPLGPSWFVGVVGVKRLVGTMLPTSVGNMVPFNLMVPKRSCIG